MGRSFYEDEELITTKPGFNTEINAELKEKESSHGNISFVEGMGVRSTPYLEKYAEKFRLALHENLSVISAELGTQKTALLNEYANLQQKVDEIVKDPVVPQLVNIVGPILLTSVIVSRRSLPVRFLATSLVGGACIKYYMPRTYDELKQRLIVLEREQIPELHKKRLETMKNIQVYKMDAEKYGEHARKDLERQIHHARKWLERVMKD